MTEDTYLRGHDAFPLPKEHEWRRTALLDAHKQLVQSMCYGLDRIERLHDEVYHNEWLSTGMMTPYAHWASRILDEVMQSHAHLHVPLSQLAAHAGEVDALLEDERRAGVDEHAENRELRRLAEAVVARPSSRVERDKLATYLKEGSS